MAPGGKPWRPRRRRSSTLKHAPENDSHAPYTGVPLRPVVHAEPLILVGTKDAEESDTRLVIDYSGSVALDSRATGPGGFRVRL